MIMTLETIQILYASSTIAQYGGGTQPTNISRSDRGQNNRPSNSTKQFYNDPREKKGYSRVLDNSNLYQDDRCHDIGITLTA